MVAEILSGSPDSRPSTSSNNPLKNESNKPAPADDFFGDTKPSFDEEEEAPKAAPKKAASSGSLDDLYNDL
jgi:hypothetical protein